MHLLPYYQETIVLPFSGKETAIKLLRLTRPLEKGVEYSDETEKNFLFNGWVKDNRFRISRKVRHPENFLPLIVGTIESTSAGSIVFLRYSLFFSSALFLSFWTIITLLLCLFFVFLEKNYMYATISGGFGILNYIIATKNFHLQIRSSRKALHEALNQ